MIILALIITLILIIEILMRYCYIKGGDPMQNAITTQIAKLKETGIIGYSRPHGVILIPEHNTKLVYCEKINKFIIYGEPIRYGKINGDVARSNRSRLIKKGEFYPIEIA